MSELDWTNRYNHGLSAGMHSEKPKGFQQLLDSYSKTGTIRLSTHDKQSELQLPAVLGAS